MMGAGLILQHAVEGVVGDQSITARVLPGLVHVVGDFEGGENPVPDAHLIDFAGEVQIFILDFFRKAAAPPGCAPGGR